MRSNTPHSTPCAAPLRTPLPPRQAVDWLARGQDRWQRGRYDDAAADFEQAYRLDPRPETVARLIQARIALADIARVTDLTDEAIARWPDTPAVELFGALAALHRNDLGRCLEHLERGLRQAPGNPALQVGRQLMRQRLEREPAPLPFTENRRGNALIDSLAVWTAHPRAEWTAYPPLTLLRAVRQAPPGLVLECGVYWGRSIRLLASVGRRPVHGFDSFQGLPEDWSPAERRGSYSTGGRLPLVPSHVQLHAGWFEDSLPRFLQEHAGPVGLLHVDCDLYRSTRTVLETLAPRLRPGTIVVFDDFVGYPGWRENEHRAWEAFATSRGIGYEMLWMSFLGREVALRLTEVPSATP